MEDLVTPGQRLGRDTEFAAGPGTFIRQNFLFASVIGTRRITPASEESPKPMISVLQGREQVIVPSVGSIVTAQVTKVNNRFASVSILCVDDKPVREPFQGMIRQQDVRKFEIDKVELYKCFRPGDMVKAQVISLGDSRSYFLSTAENHLGVIFAQSIAGVAMIPISWQEMQCPKTKVKEFRKVAKPE